MVSRSALSQILIGLSVLVFSGVVYITDRPPEHVYFLHETFSLYVNGQPIFGAIGANLPTFAHVFAFILITSGLLPPGGRRSRYTVCATWFGIDMAFEIGQHPAVAAQLLPLIPDWFQQVPILDNTRSYFTHGTFDVLDALSIIVGATLAYMILAVMQRKEKRR